MRDQPNTLEQVLEWHLRHYPLLGPADVYKLLHQGVYGPSHIVAGREAARDGLAHELAGLEPRPGLPEMEPLDPEGRLVRVNLAPLLDEDFVPERLAEALVATAAEVHGDAILMRQRLAVAVAWAEGVVPHLAAPVAELAASAEGAGFPARHHTEVFLRNYRPAYRVVLARLWPELSD